MDRSRITSLQILRFVAAVAVVVSHSPGFILVATGTAAAPSYFEPCRIGAAGVDVFFVLSGFVIALTGPLAAPEPSAALFYWRRWRRVAPVYFIISAVPVAVFARTGQLNRDQLLATFLFWPATETHFVKPIVDVGWTLCFEMVFYTSVALFLAGRRRPGGLYACAAVVAGALVLRAFTGATSLRFLTSPMFLEFGAGVFLATRRKSLSNRPIWQGVVLVLAGAAALGAQAIHGLGDFGELREVLTFGHDLSRALLWGLPAAAIVAGSVVLDRLCRGPAADLFSAAGDASYSIYLVQGYTLLATALVWRQLGLSTSYVVLFVGAVAGATVGGYLVYLVIERPVLGLLKLVRFRAPAVAATT